MCDVNIDVIQWDNGYQFTKPSNGAILEYSQLKVKRRASCPAIVEIPHATHIADLLNTNVS